MRVRTTVAIALLTGAFCFSAGSILSPGPYRLVYITAKPLLVTNSRGESLGRLPAGTHVISKLRLSNSPDIGWWCFVPRSEERRVGKGSGSRVGRYRSRSEGQGGCRR